MSSLGALSAARLKGAHPLLQQLFGEVAQRVDIVILDSQRGREAQEEAFRKGNSKVHFGDSAHNWTPSVALDVAPAPVDWDNRSAFVELSKIVLPIARMLSIPIRWGGDWNGNGILTDEKLSDLPHYELTPWRQFAQKDCVLFGVPPEAGYPTLSLGDRGTDVIELQRQLAAAGLYSRKIDGDFGINTRAAVATLQMRAGLTTDGVAGPKTRSALSDLL